jgi:hypothetical protein
LPASFHALRDGYSAFPTYLRFLVLGIAWEIDYDFLSDAVFVLKTSHNRRPTVPQAFITADGERSETIVTFLSSAASDHPQTVRAPFTSVNGLSIG